MSVDHVKYLIVGGGVAGASAASAIRELDPAGSLRILSAEPTRPYDRPRIISGYLSRTTDRVAISTRPSGWYAQHNIDLRTGVRVTQLDCGRRRVTLASGAEVSGDTLLLAVGAVARVPVIPGASLPGLYTLRTLDDADRLLNAIDRAVTEGRAHDRGRGRVSVLGGGLLAVELSGFLAGRGIEVDLLPGGPVPWWKFAGETLGQFACDRLRDAGVKVHPHVRAERLEGDGRIQRVVTSDYQILACDFVVSAIGATPNRELLRNTPIHAEKAILTTAQAQTNIQGVFAAGDCSAIFDPLFGKHRIVDHHPHAVQAGRLAGRNMAHHAAGRPLESFSGVTHFSTLIGRAVVHCWGEPRLVDHRLVRSDSAGIAEIGVDPQGRCTAICATGRDIEHHAFERLVSCRLDCSNRHEQLKDPNSPLPQV